MGRKASAELRLSHLRGIGTQIRTWIFYRMGVEVQPDHAVNSAIADGVGLTGELRDRRASNYIGRVKAKSVPGDRFWPRLSLIHHVLANRCVSSGWYNAEDIRWSNLSDLYRMRKTNFDAIAEALLGGGGGTEAGAKKRCVPSVTQWKDVVASQYAASYLLGKELAALEVCSCGLLTASEKIAPREATVVIDPAAAIRRLRASGSMKMGSIMSMSPTAPLVRCHLLCTHGIMMIAWSLMTSPRRCSVRG